jgi:uncharacterized repeat protein (TIGR01451 family)
MDSTRKIYRCLYRGIFLCLVFHCMLGAGNALAAGTPAGTIITNTASVSYQIGGVTHTAATGSASFAVDRVVNLIVTKIADVTSAPTQTNAALSYLVSNTSNTAARFTLQAVSRMTNTWSMNNARIYRDNNNSGTWDAGDSPYSDASTFGDIASDSSFTVMIVADTPAGQTAGQTAVYDLLATAVDAGTLNVTTQTAGPNTTGVDTVFADSGGSAGGDGARDGKHSAGGTFTISSALVVTIQKSVAVFDQWGGNQSIPGATLRYTITVFVTGIGTANNVAIIDPLPANTAAIHNTLRLNNTVLTDALDGDGGDVGQTTANTITVRLGNLTSALPVQTITFDVKIN